MRSAGKVLGGLLLCACVSGCQYYSVSGAESAEGHITHNWRCWQSKGNARFIDLKTGKEVRLTEARFHPIPADEATAELAAAERRNPRPL